MLRSVARGMRQRLEYPLELRFLAIRTLCKHALDFAGALNAPHTHYIDIPIAR